LINSNENIYILTPQTYDKLTPKTDFSCKDFALLVKRKYNLQDITIVVNIRKLKSLGKKVNLWDFEAVHNYIQDSIQRQTQEQFRMPMLTGVSIKVLAISLRAFLDRIVIIKEDGAALI